MKLRKLFYIIISSILIIGISANANELGDLVNEEYQNLTPKVVKSQNKSTNAHYLLKTVKLRFRGKVGIDVAFVAKLSIKPFIEFKYTRKKRVL